MQPPLATTLHGRCRPLTPFNASDVRMIRKSSVSRRHGRSVRASIPGAMRKNACVSFRKDLFPTMRYGADTSLPRATAQLAGG